MKKRSKHRVLKLRDGTDIIGRIIEVDQNGMVLDKPMLYQISPVFEKGKFQYLTISFKRWFEFAKTQRYYFPKDYILAHSEPERELITDYIQAKKTNDFVDETSEEMNENDLSGLNVGDIIEKIKETDSNLDRSSFGIFESSTGFTASDNPLINDDFWRGIPRFE
jgi:hypothetical protein